MNRSFIPLAAAALILGTPAQAQAQPPVEPREGDYMGQGGAVNDRTDVNANLPRHDTTITGPMDAPPAGVVDDPRPPQMDTGTAVAPAGDLVTVIKADPELSTFAKLAGSAGFDTTFSGAGPMTVLVPSNAAFAKLPAEQLARLSDRANAKELQQVLLYHIIPASTPAGSLKGTKGEVPSARPNASLMVDGTGDVVRINGATVVRPDLRATNGIVHVIDTVLLPPANQ